MRPDRAPAARLPAAHLRLARVAAILLLLPAGLMILPEGSMAADPTTLPDFDSLWNYEAPDSTEARFREILPVARASGNRDYLAQLLTQIARTEGLQMKFDEAAKTLDEAESLITDDMKVARVRLFLERGRMLNSSKRREESGPLFESAWDLAREAHADGYAVDAAHMLGIVEPGDSSIAWNRKAIEYARQSSDPKARRWLGSLYNNLGWTYHDRKDYATALDLFRKALAAREEAGKKSDILVARWCVARTLRSLGRTEEALAMQRALLREHEAEGTRDGFVLEEIAECLAALDRADEARPYFARAHEELSKDPWLARDEPERLERLRKLGGVEAGGPSK
jgi:tetratricopeptide (TPR) repeat protein